MSQDDTSHPVLPYRGGPVPYGYKKKLVGRASNGRRLYQLEPIQEELDRLEKVRLWRLRGASWRLCAEIAKNDGWGGNIDPGWLCRLLDRYEKKKGTKVSAVRLNGRRPPYGYRLNPATGEQESDPEEQGILHRVKALEKSGSTHDQIANTLNEEGVLTRHGKSISRSIVAMWLTDP